MLSFGVFAHSSSDPEPVVAIPSGLENQLLALCDNFCYEVEKNNNDLTFDSLAYLAIEKAEASFEQELILKINLRYLEKVQVHGTYVDYRKLVDRTEILLLKHNDADKNFKSWITISKSAARLRITDLAHKYALKAFGDASMKKDPGLKVDAYLTLGKSLELQNQYIEAYQNYLNAFYQSELIPDEHKKNSVKAECYNHFYELFITLKDFEQAANNKQEVIRILENENPVDSTNLYWAKLDLWGVAVLAEKYIDLPLKFKEIIDFAIKTHNEKLKDYTFSSYRTFLIQKNDFKGFHELYDVNFSEELIKMESVDPVLYNRIQAYIAEYNQDLESANAYYLKTEHLLPENALDVFKSNFYKRYGEFLLRHDRLTKAKDSFLKSYELAKNSHFDGYMYDSSKFLDSIYLKLGNIEEAYKFAKIHQGLLNKQTQQILDKDFLLLEIQNESKRMELAQKIKNENTKKKYDVQYLLITICITFLMLLFIVASQLKVPEWVIRGSGFLGVLMIFEFLILILDHEIHHFTHGAPFWIFTIKVMILFVLFPLHHIIEHTLINYMLKNKLLWKPGKLNAKKIIHKIWPWMGE